MAKYPIYLEIGGRRVVVIGAGSVASRKVEVLCKAGAKVLVVAREIQAEFAERCEGLDIEIAEEDYSKECLEGAILVIAATNDNSLNSRVYTDCKERNLICNVVDVPEFCDFYVPATVQRGPLQIAIGTDGKSPAYSGKIRRQLDKMFTEVHGQFADEMGVIRHRVIAEVADGKVRRKIFEGLVTDDSFECFVNDGAAAWRDYAEILIQRETA